MPERTRYCKSRNDLGPSRARLPGQGMQREQQVCKLVDTTTCIGCKACEVACVEWNDMPFSPTTFDNTYQTMPETRVELLEPDQVQRAPASRTARSSG